MSYQKGQVRVRVRVSSFVIPMPIAAMLSILWVMLPRVLAISSTVTNVFVIYSRDPQSEVHSLCWHQLNPSPLELHNTSLRRVVMAIHPSPYTTASCRLHASHPGLIGIVVSCSQGLHSALTSQCRCHMTWILCFQGPPTVTKAWRRRSLVACQTQNTMKSLWNWSILVKAHLVCGVNY